VAELGVKGVQVSLEGPERVHEKIPGPGISYAVADIQTLLEVGVNVSINEEG
jgi:MoaA/NifB/PqqE/SkfB family radical SAM enzyme